MVASYWIPAEANNPGMYHFICVQNILPGADPTSRGHCTVLREGLGGVWEYLEESQQFTIANIFYLCCKKGFFGGSGYNYPLCWSSWQQGRAQGTPWGQSE